MHIILFLMTRELEAVAMFNYQSYIDVITFKMVHTKRSRILTDYSRLKVDEYSTRDVLASSGLTEECVEGVVSTSNCLVARHLTIRLDAMLQTVQFPAGVAHLHSGLADMDADAFTLQPSHCMVIRPC